MSRKFSILEKVAAIRAILSVAGAVAKRFPDRPVNEVVDAIELALLRKLDNLRKKPFASLTANQQSTLGVLEVSRTVMGDVMAILGDEETTQELSADEREAIASLKTAKKAKPAKKATAPAKDTKTADMFAKA